MSQQRPLQLCFGGTFDPVHNAHLRVLWEASAALQADLVRLLPCRIPPHKGMPSTSPDQRVAMLRLALQDQPDWRIDQRELEREKPSYSVDTLKNLRRQFGPDVALVWLMGMDSFASLNTWHRWQDVGELAHLLVVGRPGSQLPSVGPVADWTRTRLAQGDLGKALRASPHGKVALLQTTQQDIASSNLREAVRTGLAPRYLVPDAVCEYIVDQQLYTL